MPAPGRVGRVGAEYEQVVRRELPPAVADEVIEIVGNSFHELEAFERLHLENACRRLRELLNEMVAGPRGGAA